MLYFIIVLCFVGGFGVWCAWRIFGCSNEYCPYWEKGNKKNFGWYEKTGEYRKAKLDEFVFDESINSVIQWNASFESENNYYIMRKVKVRKHD